MPERSSDMIKRWEACSEPKAPLVVTESKNLPDGSIEHRIIHGWEVVGLNSRPISSAEMQLAVKKAEAKLGQKIIFSTSTKTSPRTNLL